MENEITTFQKVLILQTRYVPNQNQQRRINDKFQRKSELDMGSGRPSPR